MHPRDDDRPTAELQCLLEATVLPEEIDHLGHMNVRYYLEKALRSTERLSDQHGLGPEAADAMGATFALRDVFTRHYREQLVGAPLAVYGGVLDVRGDGLRIYHELRNTEREELAAAFVHDVQLRRRETREPLPLPEMVAKSAGDARVEWPEHGRARSLDLDQVPAKLTLEVARERGLEMRRERTVQADECDADGHFVAQRYMELVWGGEPLDGRTQWMPLFEKEDGGQFGWATLESRGVLLDLPRVGARVQCFGAEVDIANKTSIRHQWVFDLDTEQLLCTSSIVNLAFDIGARRSIEIPARLREVLEAQYHPDLR